MLVILCENMDGGSYWLAPLGCYGWWFVMLYFHTCWATSGRLVGVGP